MVFSLRMTIIIDVIPTTTTMIIIEIKIAVLNMWEWKKGKERKCLNIHRYHQSWWSMPQSEYFQQALKCVELFPRPLAKWSQEYLVKTTETVLLQGGKERDETKTLMQTTSNRLLGKNRLSTIIRLHVQIWRFTCIICTKAEPNTAQRILRTTSNICSFWFTMPNFQPNMHNAQLSVLVLVFSFLAACP